MKAEKAFEVEEFGRAKAVAAQEKLRGERVELQKKFEAEKKKTQAFQAENAKLSKPINRLKVVEESVKEMTGKVESLPTQFAEAAKTAA